MSIQAPGLQEAYAYETCGLCEGNGKGLLAPNIICPPCGGTGKVLVHQPPIPCPRCDGSGMPAASDYYDLGICVVCRGAGWVMALLD